MSSLYINKRLAIINFTSKYFKNVEELLASEEYSIFLKSFLSDLKKSHPGLYIFLKENKLETKDLIKISKLLYILDINELEEVNKHKDKYLELVEAGYHYWRNLHRFSTSSTYHKEGYVLNNFMEADMKFSKLIITFYRTLQEKLQGAKNSIYRQLQAGTNGSLLLSEPHKYEDRLYNKLNNIKVIEKLMLRAPLIVHLDYNKRSDVFVETNRNPLNEDYDYEDFYAYPCLVGESKTIVYFHKDFLASAIGIANLFEYLPLKQEDKPDCILLFGVKEDKEETTFYYDKSKDIFIGKLSYMPRIEYFGYFKKMMLTLHNLRMIQINRLPIHGAMLNIYLEDGTKKGVCFMGDSGAGKSETLEALSKYADNIAYEEVIFDDMGSMYINKKGQVVCQGTEIGAFTRLDDLDAGAAYKDIDRSIFFNPESKNSRVVMPVSTHKLITTEHKVDIFLYANNYEDIMGIEQIEHLDRLKTIYKEGKRYAIGTTSETAISTTYFANPFGPMQKQKECDKIIDNVFNKLQENNIIMGQLYTHLSLKNREEGLKKAAEELIKLIKN